MSMDQLERKRTMRRDLCEKACEGIPDAALAADIVYEMGVELARCKGLLTIAQVLTEAGKDSAN